MIGRHLFDFTDGWGRAADRRRPGLRGHPPRRRGVAGALPRRAVHVLCRGRRGRDGRATEHAGDGTVVVCAGEVGGQVVAAGLADELAVDLAPVFLGQGKSPRLQRQRGRRGRPARRDPG